MSVKYETATIIESRIHKNKINVVFPSVIGLNNKVAQARINELIESVVRSMIASQEAVSVDLVEIVGNFTVELNGKSLLSIRFENFAQWGASGTTLLEAITVDLKTGENYSLGDLFLKNRPYRVRLNEIILAQIKIKDIPTISEFPGVTDQQGFYLTPTSLVIFFPELEFTPHVVGPPEFVIPYNRLLGLINPKGPIGRLVR